MDPGVRSPFIDFFRRGEVASDVRLLAAQGALAPRALEQVALLMILADDADPTIAKTATLTIDALPGPSVARFLALRDATPQMRDFFAARGIEPDGGPVDGGDDPLVQPADEPTADAGEEANPRVLSMLPVIDRMKLAMRGSREQRSQLIRDSNRLVAAAVLSSPKLNESEIESFARMANLSEDVLRVVATNRAWTKNYNVVAALTRNPKTPTALAMGFLQRLNERDLKTLSTDRNVSEPVRLAARKYVAKGPR
ncbi:MAG: hypothetical protein H0W08_03385 [Acidobacteria bacterium]|nr:hypothetical protein [Acidobacteriota bacterium]